MNRSDTSLEPVDLEGKGLGDHLVQESVLRSEKRAGSYDSGAGEDIPDELLTLGLSAVKPRDGVGGCVEVGDMDKAVNAMGPGSLGEFGGCVGKHIIEAVVLRLVLASDQVIDNVRVPEAVINEGLVGQIKLERYYLAQVSHHAQMSL